MWIWEGRDVADGGHCCFCSAGRQHGGYEASEGGWRGYELEGMVIGVEEYSE